jgi:RHH-type proline utilization regulon transcriptional repressor/proline dehydrogenase/delta 1-pyrroline-5-carboxylate dehydrogenase
VVAESEGREREIQEVARRIADLEGGQRARAFHLSWWSDRLLARSMADHNFRTRLFRFVDAFPSLASDEEIEEHLRSEFEGVEVPRWFGAGMGLTRSVPGGARVSASVARRGIDRMARQFVIGTDADEVAVAVGHLWRKGTATTVDVLGEHTYSEAEADRYASRLSELVETLGAAARNWPADGRLERDDLGEIPRASVSVKATALASSFEPLSGEHGIERAARRLIPIMKRASELGVSVWLDTERFEEKELTQRLFRRVLSVPGLETLHAGMVLQAYLRDSAEDLESFAAWARGRPVVPSVRLVKGAYWDSEVLHASAHGWPVPVFEDKAETDSNYERLARRLLEQHGTLRPAFASHNLRSLAAAIVDARALGLPDDSFEIQLLYGMAEPVHEAVRRSGMRLRVYAPVGELIPGMAYLVRRLLENTSNESFVRHHFADRESLDALIAAPALVERSSTRERNGAPDSSAESSTDSSRPVADPDSPGEYAPEPLLRWHLRKVMSDMSGALDSEFARDARRVAAIVGGEKLRTSETFDSVDPSDPDSVVAEVDACSAAEVEAAVATARAAFAHWAATDVRERARVLFKAAEVIRSRRMEIAALEVRETAKGWSDADADVCEAIDYCEYYARRMLVLAGGAAVQSPAGEQNRMTYRARGVCAVISPWNFPLAIPAGMTSAALVCGNTVVLKPAEQAPAVAAELVKAFLAAGLPPGALSFVPGGGEAAGRPLVEHPEVDLVAFTGSRDVGLWIVETAARRERARRSIPRVIAELGGKNAIVVDADADLDEVVPAVISSAFGFAGQKCSAASRLIAVDPVHDKLVDRVGEAARSLVIGPPRSPGSQLGPVIDEDAYDRLRDAVSRAAEVGTVVSSREDLPEKGWFVGPVVVSEVDPDSWLANEELFGPVLATFRIPDFESALDLANATDYALTAGLFSRSEEHVRLGSRRLRAGNVYVNRPITGAVVGRQPFGGSGMSGVGSKAGGPDYLLQFLDPQVVSENTIRQGFAPDLLVPGHDGVARSAREIDGLTASARSLRADAGDAKSTGTA